MSNYSEQQLVGMAMRKYGGGFAKSLGMALMHADSDNCERIKSAFPELWDQYLKMSDHLEE